MILVDSGNPVLAHPRLDPPTTRKLEKGDLFISEYVTSYAGYELHTECSISIGEPRKEYREIFKVCKEASDKSTAKLRPGISFKEVIKAERAPVYEAGMDCITCGYIDKGLGVGPVTFNGPDSALEEIAPILIKENMTLGNMIDLFNPRWINGGGVILGDTYLVTKDGPRKLTDIPLELVVV